MKWRRAAGPLDAGHDTAPAIASFRVGELSAAQAGNRIVVAAFIVGCQKSSRASGVGLQARVSTSQPVRSADPPCCFKHSIRSGEDGLKNGPSGLPKVASSPSWHGGLAASGT